MTKHLQLFGCLKKRHAQCSQTTFWDLITSNKEKNNKTIYSERMEIGSYFDLATECDMSCSNWKDFKSVILNTLISSSNYKGLIITNNQLNQANSRLNINLFEFDYRILIDKIKTPQQYKHCCAKLFDD